MKTDTTILILITILIVLLLMRQPRTQVTTSFQPGLPGEQPPGTGTFGQVISWGGVLWAWYGDHWTPLGEAPRYTYAAG